MKTRKTTSLLQIKEWNSKVFLDIAIRNTSASVNIEKSIFKTFTSNSLLQVNSSSWQSLVSPNRALHGEKMQTLVKGEVHTFMGEVRVRTQGTYY